MGTFLCGNLFAFHLSMYLGVGLLGHRLPRGLVVKNPHANAGDVRDTGSVSELGRSPGGGHSNPLQYSCLESPTDTGAWWATVQWVTQSWTWLKRLSTHARDGRSDYGFPLGIAVGWESGAECS